MNTRRESRERHLIYLAHLWVCMPFLAYWLSDAGVRADLGAESVASLYPAVWGVALYTVVRTVLAFLDPPWLPWDRFYPPVDVAIISVILHMTEQGIQSNIALLYFLPIAQALGTLDVRWVASVGVLVVGGCAIAAYGTYDQRTIQLQAFNAGFRFYFLVIIASLLAFQARSAAKLREDLAISEERRRLAEEMHDGVQGHLVATATTLELIAKVASQNPARAADLAQEGREWVLMGADELRFLVRRMRTDEVSATFAEDVRAYAEGFCRRINLPLAYLVEPLPNLTVTQQHAVFRVVQEALTNVAKHAQANSVTVHVGGPALVRVADDGIGFAHVPEGGGLASMQHRVERAGMVLDIDSRVGIGTQITVKLVA